MVIMKTQMDYGMSTTGTDSQYTMHVNHSHALISRIPSHMMKCVEVFESNWQKHVKNLCADTIKGGINDNTSLTIMLH